MPRPTLGLVRVPGNLSQEHRRREGRGEDACSSTRPSVDILLDHKFEPSGKVYNSRLQAVRSKNLPEFVYLFAFSAMQRDILFVCFSTRF